MKISANAIGNYSPVYARKPVHEQKPAENSTPVSFRPQVTNGNAELTTVEKEFFAALYPQEKTEIMDYHFYQKNGQMSGVKIGSMFDKRG